MPAAAARSLTCFALSGLANAPRGTTNAWSFSMASARWASDVFAGFAEVLVLSFLTVTGRVAGSTGAALPGGELAWTGSLLAGGDGKGGRIRVLNGPPSGLGICTVSS